MCIVDKQVVQLWSLAEIAILGRSRGTVRDPSFDPVFLPDGSDKTLAEDKPDEVNARAKAVDNFVKDIPFAIANPIFDWEGEYQSN